MRLRKVLLSALLLCAPVTIASAQVRRSLPTRPIPTPLTKTPAPAPPALALLALTADSIGGRPGAVPNGSHARRGAAGRRRAGRADFRQCGGNERWPFDITLSGPAPPNGIQLAANVDAPQSATHACYPRPGFVAPVIPAGATSGVMPATSCTTSAATRLPYKCQLPRASTPIRANDRFS